MVIKEKKKSRYYITGDSYALINSLSSGNSTWRYRSGSTWARKIGGGTWTNVDATYSDKLHETKFTKDIKNNVQIGTAATFTSE